MENRRSFRVGLALLATLVLLLAPGRWYTVTLRLQPQDRVLAAGHRLGLLLSLSDTENTSPATTGATVTVDLAHSGLGLPVAGPARFGTPRTAPEVTASAATAPHRPERAMP